MLHPQSGWLQDAFLKEAKRIFLKKFSPSSSINNLGSKKRYLRELCRELRKVNKVWSAAATIDVTDDPSLVLEMALSGCTGVFVGLESLVEKNLIDARKKTPRPDEYARRVNIFHS